jgi:hypothetical protein
VKRRWRCIEAASETKTWTELSDHVDAQAVLTRRAAAVPFARRLQRSIIHPPYKADAMVKSKVGTDGHVGFRSLKRGRTPRA